MKKKAKKVVIPGGFVKCNLPFGPIYPKSWSKDMKEGDSFTERGLAIAGMLIITEDGEQYLIGHINQRAGLCDDCQAFEPTTKIFGYKQAWKDDKKSTTQG